MTFCTHCGEPLDGGAFCTTCGRRAADLADTSVLPPLQPITRQAYVPPPPAPQSTKSKGPLIAVVASVAALAIGAGVGAWVLLSGKDAPRTTVAATTTMPAFTSSLSITLDADPSETPTRADFIVPPTESDIDFSAVRTFPDLTHIATVLDVYFTGVNAHDAEKAISVFSTRGVSNPDDAKNVAQLASGIQSTRDDTIRVTAIGPSISEDATGASTATTAVVVHFRSQQAAADGYQHQTCSHWTITYHLITVPAWVSAMGQTTYKVLGSKAEVPSAC